jgi:aspartyl/asparaginyl beta-hydroxylase (cupin superfamily)
VNQVKKPYYSFAHGRERIVTSETFFDPSSFAWAPGIEKNHPVILSEISAYLDGHNALKPYFATEMMSAPEKWKAFSFYFWGLRMNANACARCPETIRLLSGIPNIISASVSVLEPHSAIKGHFGDTDAIYRCHYGLVVPAALPECGFRVGYEDKPWENGKFLIFNDANYHRAWNHTDKRRVVLILDVIRPQFGNRKRWICARVHGNIMWLTASQATGIFRGRKNPFTKTVTFLLALFAWLRLYSLNRKSAWL